MRIRFAASALTLSAALVLAGCAGDTADEAATPTADAPTATATSSATATAEDTTDVTGDEAATDANEADAMFATMMLPHHEQAIVMSDMVLAKEGVDQRVVDLAQQIKDAQGPEIAQLETWLDEWGVDRSEHGGDHQSMEGMLSEEQLAQLDAAGGAEASRLFLEQMIAHHEGAVTMAQTEIEDGAHPDAVAMAQSIVESQNAEIEYMRELLADL